jgi:hypothetical protein
MTYKLIYIFLFFYFSSFCWSQETSTLPETPDELKTDELLNIELPPLDVLFESSRQSPAVEIYKLRLQQEASTLKTERRSWLKYFSLSSTFQYGSVGVNNYMSTVDIAPMYSSLTFTVKLTVFVVEKSKSAGISESGLLFDAFGS